MKQARSPKKQRPLTTTLVPGVIIGSLIFGIAFIINMKLGLLWLISGKLTDNKTYLIYVPNDLAQGKRYPLVFALSPSGDAMSMISIWSSIAEERKWIIAASKEFRNGLEIRPSMAQVATDLTDIENRYPIDARRLIFTRMSGGGMGAHAFSKLYPNRVSALVINTGMMEETLMTRDYPREKLVVFFASPTDFRVNEMKRDFEFLVRRQWKAKWIEFSGGHKMAPASVYKQAAQWLEDNFP